MPNGLENLEVDQFRNYKCLVASGAHEQIMETANDILRIPGQDHVG